MRTHRSPSSGSSRSDPYGAFAANKDVYALYVPLVEAFLETIGAKLAPQKPVKIDVAKKIGPGKKKQRVTWSISYTLPESVKVDAAHVADLKSLDADLGS